jgi:2-methylisocitrate lyase-like PEP mutase family enzyme
MQMNEKALAFAKLHSKGSPLRLYNAWDAGSAKVIAEAGANAIATSSWAVAAAHDYRDGEQIPQRLVEEITARIVQATPLPVTLDFEGGYTDDDATLADNIGCLIDIGVVGINFEDRVVGGAGLYPINRQARRIAAIRGAAKSKGAEFFINARSDVFFGSDRDHAKLLEEAQQRASAYASAGASGFFAPGLLEEGLIQRLCAGVSLPVNLMMMKGAPSVERLGALGVSRISYGASPYADAMARLREAAVSAFSAG